MSEETFDLTAQLDQANAKLPVDLSQMTMPLDMQVRSVALTLAQRHCGDTTVKEGNLYQQLKMDNKLAGPLTVEHVIHCALIFERFLWGEFSKDIAGNALADALGEMDKVIQEAFDGDNEEPPARPHSGGQTE
jgi:hypothetical protein